MCPHRCALKFSRLLSSTAMCGAHSRLLGAVNDVRTGGVPLICCARTSDGAVKRSHALHTFADGPFTRDSARSSLQISIKCVRLVVVVVIIMLVSTCARRRSAPSWSALSGAGVGDNSMRQCQLSRIDCGRRHLLFQCRTPTALRVGAAAPLAQILFLRIA